MGDREEEERAQRPRREADRTQITLAKLALIGTIFGTSFTGIMTYMMAKLTRQQTVAAEQTEQVAETLAVVTVQEQVEQEHTTAQLEEIHTLVNSNMGVQLELNMRTTRRLADITRNKDDIAAAQLAEDAYNEHITQQAVADAAAPPQE